VAAFVLLGVGSVFSLRRTARAEADAKSAQS
jgi:hypothetical protein